MNDGINDSKFMIQQKMLSSFSVQMIGVLPERDRSMRAADQKKR